MNKSPISQVIASKRLETIFSELLPCKRFADVGCDHGYIARAMLKSGKAERVVISDISAPSLKKAEKLLEGEGEKVTSVVCDGLSKVPRDCDEVLIAGMGGEEIVSILDAAPFLPERIVAQPMKNADKVRKSLLSHGYGIEKDYLFKDGKFYFLISASLFEGRREYGEDELFFGWDNIHSPSRAFKEYVKKTSETLEAVLKGELSERSRKEVEELKNKYDRIYIL